MVENKHNGIISFWKFAFSILIIALHLGFKYANLKYNFNGGSIAVEFFFIVSGYLFCNKALNYKDVDTNDLGKETISFTISKIKRFLPYIIFLIVISLPYVLIIKKYNIVDFSYIILNLLYLPTYQNRVYDIYGITWYITSLIIVETLLFPLVLKYRKKIIYFFSPVLCYILINYILIKYESFAIPWSLDVFSYGGIIRGLFGINLGMILYVVVQKIKTINFTDFSRFLLTLFEIIGYFSIFVISNKVDSHFRYDLLMIIIISCSIVVSFSNKSLMNDFCNNKLFFFLEKISLPIYINQWLIIDVIGFIIKKMSIHISYYIELLIVIIISIIFGGITLKIVELLKNNSKKIKNIFIEN